MELASHIFLLLVPILLYIYFHKLRNGGNEKVKLPPGTSGFPFIGESLRFYSKLRQGCPHEFVKERMDKYSSKVFRTSLMGHPMAFLCGAEGNKFLFTNEHKLVRSWWPPVLDKLFPTATGQPISEIAYKVHKSILTLFLTPEPLKQFHGFMDAVMKRHVEVHWTGKNDGVVNVSEIAKLYTLTLSCYFFLGDNEIDQMVEEMTDMESATTTMPSINLPGTTWNRGMGASRNIRSKIAPIVRKRRDEFPNNLSSSSSSAKPRDFISHMMVAVDENGELFSDEDIASLLAGLIMGAYTSLHTLITLLVNNLSNLPNVYESVLKEQTDIAALKEGRDKLSWEDTRKMKYSWNAIREILRVQNPVIFFKEVTNNFTYEGYTIPKGWKICWMSHATQRDPKYFENPEEFDPTRFDGDTTPYTFIPFGGGSRLCPGNEYVKLAVLTFVHYVVTQFKWEKVNPNEQFLHFPLPRPAQGLPIRIQPIKPSTF